MFESKYNKLLTIILIVVIVAIIALIAFLAINYFNETGDTKKAADFVENYNGDEITPVDNTPQDTTDEPTEENTNPLEEETEQENTDDNIIRTRKQYNGFYVNGTMRIPKIDFSYPVLESVTKASIENSVAILYGAGLNQIGNTVIVGHNYRNGQFFSNNKRLEEGDKIYIKDNDGVEKSYTIYSKFETTPEDTSFYQRDTNGKAEVTLSTCTDDSSARLIILAREDD